MEEIMERVAAVSSSARHMSLLPTQLQVLDRMKKEEGEETGEGDRTGEEEALLEHVEHSRSMPELAEMEPEQPFTKKSVNMNFMEIMKEVRLCNM